MDRLWRIIDSVLSPRSRLGSLNRKPADQERGSTDRAAPGPRRRLPLRDVILNGPLMIGLAIVVALFVLVLMGPVWAPQNPYVSAQHIVPHYDAELGEAINPPLPPSSEFPFGTDRWGNDLLSLLMHGARNTLVACSFITMVRVSLGLILGAIAGWNESRFSDHVVMALVGVITSVPMLIGSIILIYSLDIRKGLPVFIVALSAVGWTEVAQYVRSEFMVLRKMPYIEGARAVGLNGFALAVRHVLPNILPQLLVISFLEMGAVMMLLGELGFVGVYIGGGSRIAVETDPFTFELRTLIEVPEWGAMLADGYRWLRSRPFVILPPATAFAISVLGFNALGEGLRRLVEQNSLNTAFLLRKRVLLLAPVLVLATAFVIQHTGPAPWLAKVAGAFDGKQAYAHVKALSGMDGRGAGQEGGARAAAYIAGQFAAYGLEPGWKQSRYEYPLQVRLAQPVKQPHLALLDASGAPVQEFRHQLEFGFVTQGHGGSGDAQARLAFVGFQRKPDTYTWESFKGLDLRERIVLLLEGNAPPDFATEAMIRGARGVLWVSADGSSDVRSQVRLVDRDYLRTPTMPVFRIRPSVAGRLLEEDGLSLAHLLAVNPDSAGSGAGWFIRDLSVSIHMELALSDPSEVEVPCVLGYKPGSDHDLAGQLIVLFASYDGLGTDPDGTVFPGANHDASGIGILLEVARLWKAQNLDARRSVLFVAWGGGEMDPTGAEPFLIESTHFRYLPAAVANEPAFILQLDRLGAGGDTLLIHPGSNKRLANLLEESAAEAGVPVTYDTGELRTYDDPITRRIPWITLRWTETDGSPDQDTLEYIEGAKLQGAGQAISLALTKMVRQTEY